MSNLKSKLKELLAPVIYKHINSGLQPHRLYYYLDTLWNLRSVQGGILEIGCNMAGTAILAKGMLEKLNIQKTYECIDTFGGFIEDQFENDSKKYNVPEKNKYSYSSNSLALVKKILRMHNREDIKLIQGDIVTFDILKITSPVSVCLLDVDLEIPIYEGLKKLSPHISKGGVILVDDCPESTSWGGARKGYEKFMEEIKKPPVYKFGFGILQC